MAHSAFDPAQHLSSIKGQDYLEVKWRLAWLRSEHPDAVITTQLVSHQDDRAIFSADVSIPEGGSATGWGSETVGSFGNYIEKAETKAIGRALAALGFGTQFCLDFDDGPESGVLADAPVQIQRTGQNQARTQQAEVRESQSSYDPLTDRQKGKIKFEAERLGLNGTQLDDMAQSITGIGVTRLSKRQASRFINHLTTLENETKTRKAS